jgi:hypothetical protein
MKHSVLKKVGSEFLIIGLAFALPAYAEMQDGRDATGIPDKWESREQHMSEMMRDMSIETKNMSDMMGSGSMNLDMKKKMSSQMKHMGSMMKDMSGMMNKDGTMDAGMQKKMELMHKQMEQMHKQMEQLHKDMPASPVQK